MGMSQYRPPVNYQVEIGKVVEKADMKAWL